MNNIIKKIDENNLIIPAIDEDFKELKINYHVKVLKDQTMYFQGERYGFLNQANERIYVAKGRKIITINYKNEITIQNVKYNLFCKKDYKGKKVILPNLKSIQNLIMRFKKEGLKINRNELNDIYQLLDQKISKIKALKNNV